MYQFLPNRIAYHSLQANAPICLSIAGALNLIAASGQDFALHSKPERHRFQFLQWPESFRASLYQVANSVTTAFDQAHLSMLDIEFCTKIICTNFDVALNAMAKDFHESISNGLLSVSSIGDIKKIVKHCKHENLKVVKGYETLINELTELTDATRWTKSVTDEACEKTKFAMKVIEAELKIIKEQKRKLDVECDQLKNQLMDEQSAFETALRLSGSQKKTPGLVSAGVAGSLAVLLTTGMTAGLAAPLWLLGSAATGVTAGAFLSSFQSARDESGIRRREEVEVQMMRCEAQEFERKLKELMDLVFKNENTFNENVVKDQSTVLMAFQNLVDVQLTKIGSFGENEIKEELSELLNRSSKLILAILKTSHHDWKTVQKLHRECQSIIEDSVTCRASLSQQPSSHLWMSVRDQYYKPNLTIIQLP